MRVTFTGVGEAFDETQSNTSILLESGSSSLLLDCGFTAAHAFWAAAAAPLSLDGVYVSHFHGDHFMGLPALLLRFKEQGRVKPLSLIGPRGIQDVTNRAMELAYGSLTHGRGYHLQYHEVGAEPVGLAGFDLEFAPGDHSATAFGVRVRSRDASVYYSGDGRPTRDTQDLARDVDLVVHEAYCLEGDVEGHGTVPQACEFARTAGARNLALVHINRDVRRAKKDRILEELAAFQGRTGVTAMLPEAGQAVDLP
jgi:ribonuclease BN (tRNA processing enzyme)